MMTDIKIDQKLDTNGGYTKKASHNVKATRKANSRIAKWGHLHNLGPPPSLPKKRPNVTSHSSEKG